MFCYTKKPLILRIFGVYDANVIAHVAEVLLSNL